MIKTGIYNKLKVIAEESYGLILSDKSGDEVVLSYKEAPEDLEVGESIEVFIYMDKSNKKKATTRTPKIQLNQFAKLKVATVTDRGAFMEWGMDKHLFVPMTEQRIPMEEGEYHFIYMLQDADGERLYGSRRVERYLQNDELTVKEGDQVDITIYQIAGDVGLSVIINNKHKGMIHRNQLFQKFYTGETTKGWIQRIREDNKIDVSLQPIGFRKANDMNEKLILQMLDEHNGFLPLNDKSSPKDISELLGLSKKAFKKAIGTLYKNRVLEINKDGIKLI